MAIKRKIKYKANDMLNSTNTENLKQKDLPTDRVRFEEHDEREYKKHLKKFFKGEDEDNSLFNCRYKMVL